jgi:hypothetical protein
MKEQAVSGDQGKKQETEFAQKAKVAPSLFVSHEEKQLCGKKFHGRQKINMLALYVMIVIRSGGWTRSRGMRIGDVWNIPKFLAEAISSSQIARKFLFCQSFLLSIKDFC